MQEYLKKMNLSDEVLKILSGSKKVVFPRSREELLELTVGMGKPESYDVSYEVEGMGDVIEANVTKCKNGISINYPTDYMRRRDPDCLLIADKLDSDKPKYDDVYHEDFSSLRTQTFDWLESQELVVFPFMSGGDEYGYESLCITPLNAVFFAATLADLQGFLGIDQISDGFTPKAIVYVAPPFRHTHFNGKQIVIHNRLPQMHEVFSYNLYPGPSAKKGIYGVLLNIGESEGWTTLHASTVKAITPYDNEIVVMHEGASGGGKSEMLEDVQKESDGRVMLGKNLITGEKNYIELSETCKLLPVTDDMALCPPSIQNDSKKLVVVDAEYGWFLRLDNIKEYGTDPHYEKIIIQPKEPLIFLNMQGAPNSTCLPWEHILDSTGKPCPNPRVVIPRRLIPNIVSDAVEIDLRSFGLRAPACTKENPSYGIAGLLHILPPALAWIWRLVAPRGHNNPSITASVGMTSEGVGSYWPFATGKMVDQANLLLEQILRSTHTRYVLIPNQHIGAYEVGFVPQQLAREYISRRGSAKFNPEQLLEARCTLLGFCLDSLKLDNHYIRKAFLQPDMQSEVGLEAYDIGAKMLTDFFKDELKKFDTEELHPTGRAIIKCFLNDAPLSDYMDIIPMRY